MDIIEIAGGSIVLTIDNGNIIADIIVAFPQAEAEGEAWLERHPNVICHAWHYVNGWTEHYIRLDMLRYM